MNRYEEMNNFLKFFANIYNNNPKTQITSDTIYDALSNYGLSQLEIQNSKGSNIRIKGVYFDEWIDYFKDDPNLNVYFTEVQSRFLQFNYWGGNNPELYKLYLSFPEEKILECVKQLFKFISDNNIKNISKVADSVRSDSVVLRVYNKEDVTKIIDFINNNDYINKSCKQVNPFLIKAGNVGLSYDKNLSYNEVLSYLIKQYLLEKRNTNSLNSVSIDNFRYYVINSYNTIFSNKESLIEFMNDSFVKKLIKRHSDDIIDVLSNIKDIMNLTVLQLNPNSTIDDYYNKIEIFKKPKHNEDNNLLINSIINKQEINNDVDIKTIINDYILYAFKKYNSIDTIVNCLENYMINNNINAITRDKIYPYNEGFRSLFNKYISSTTLRSIIGNKVKEYVLYNLQKNEHIDIITILDNACIATYNKYGIEQLLIAIQQGRLGNYSCFTNGGNNKYRELLIQYVDQDTFNKYANILINNIDVFTKEASEHKNMR